MSASVQTQTQSNFLSEETQHMIEQVFVKITDQICGLKEDFKTQDQLLSKIKVLKGDKEILTKERTNNINSSNKKTDSKDLDLKKSLEAELSTTKAKINLTQQHLCDSTCENAIQIAKKDSEMVFLKTKLETSEVCKRTVEKELQSIEERYSIKCNELVQKDRDIQTMRKSIAELQEELISLKIKNRIPDTTFELVTNKQQNKKSDSPGTI